MQVSQPIRLTTFMDHQCIDEGHKSEKEKDFEGVHREQEDGGEVSCGLTSIQNDSYIVSESPHSHPACSGVSGIE